jgi:hypothetical protein
VKRYATAFSYHISENNIFHGSQIGTKSGIILVLSISVDAIKTMTYADENPGSGLKQG